MLHIDRLLTGVLSCWLGTPLLSAAANGFIMKKYSPGWHLTSRSCSMPQRRPPSYPTSCPPSPLPQLHRLSSQFWEYPLFSSFLGPERALQSSDTTCVYSSQENMYIYLLRYIKTTEEKVDWEKKTISFYPRKKLCAASGSWRSHLQSRKNKIKK